MTTDGVIDTLRIISANYDNFKPPNMQDTVKLWLSAFKNFSNETVQNAVQQFIFTDTKGFAPKIGQIVDIIFSDGREMMSEVEAWGCVSRALRNSTYGAEEEFKKLPESVKRVVGNPDRLKEWAVLDEKEVQTVVASNFMRSYRAAGKESAVYDKIGQADMMGIEEMPF